MLISSICLVVTLTVGEPHPSPQAADAAAPAASMPASPYLVVLGIAQDGGYPHAGCNRTCCAPVWENCSLRQEVACVALVDPTSNTRWLIDATPDLPRQLRALDELSPPVENISRTGFLLTHAHIGHYAGLMHLGREVMGAKQAPVYAMPRMREFLTRNGPWDQLVRLDNIELHELKSDEPVALTDRLTATPLLVPHRDEYSETVGFLIKGPSRSALYIPDIDKWERWDRPIETLIAQVDVAYLDGTFFAEGEIPGRSMAEIPHPFIEESMKRFESMPAAERTKIRFIHLNHTNPALQPNSDARHKIEAAGFQVARTGERLEL